MTTTATAKRGTSRLRCRHLFRHPNRTAVVLHHLALAGYEFITRGCANSA
jgi:hypothetical protein